MSRAGASADPLARFSALDKLRLAAEITRCYVHAKVLLARHDVRQVVARVRAGAPARTGAPTRADVVHGLRLGTIVERSLRWLPGDTRCLTRSVVLVELLARRGQESTLIIGVRPGPQFGAHAWVELGGHPLLEPIDDGGDRLVDL
jgi:hypothetical protein